MSEGKIDFYGKEVTDAIKKACEILQAAQEDLDIEVVNTGSMGIFGLIRKKAHIRAIVKEAGNDATVERPKEKKKRVPKVVKPPKVQEPKEETTSVPVAEIKEESVPVVEKEKQPTVKKEVVQITAEGVEIVRQQLEQLLELMGFPSDVTAELDGATVRCRVGDEHEEVLTAQDGKIIDSLQYLLRKLAARKVEEKIRLSIDIGQFREKRKVELVERAKELAEMVKEDGKTQAIPPLNPSERRVVHVALQDDKDVRSRSVGDGLFKKVLIYKPGKGKKPSSNKRGGRGRRSKPAKKKQENSDS